MVITLRYLKEITTASITIQKSEFIALLYPLHEVTDISKWIEDAKTKYPKATHYCSASLFGSSLEYQSANDDGEPARTAGYPILEVLKHHQITNVLCIVVRYFGGIKLGAGGLVRAYTNACVEVLKSARFYNKETALIKEITFDYQWIGYLDNLLENQVIIQEKTFLEHVTYRLVFYPADIHILDEIKHQFIGIKDCGFQEVYIDDKDMDS